MVLIFVFHGFLDVFDITHPYHTVAGRNPKQPVDMENTPLLTTGFIHPNGGWEKWISSINPGSAKRDPGPSLEEHGP